MEYEEEKIYKVVYNDNGESKAPKGKIRETDENYVYLTFKDGKTISIGHKVITVISEVTPDER